MLFFIFFRVVTFSIMSHEFYEWNTHQLSVLFIEIHRLSLRIGHSKDNWGFFDNVLWNRFMSDPLCTFAFVVPNMSPRIWIFTRQWTLLLNSTCQLLSEAVPIGLSPPRSFGAFHRSTSLLHLQTSSGIFFVNRFPASTRPRGVPLLQVSARGPIRTWYSRRLGDRLWRARLKVLGIYFADFVESATRGSYWRRGLDIQRNPVVKFTSRQISQIFLPCNTWIMHNLFISELCRL